MPRAKRKNFESQKNTDGVDCVEVVLKVSVPESVLNHFLSGKVTTRTGAAKVFRETLLTGIDQQILGIQTSQAQVFPTPE